MVKIYKMIVSKAIQNRMTYGGKNSIKYIMIHQTANTSKGANANAHARLQANGNSRQASWHYSVGSDGIYQSFPDTAQAWHAGNKYYNQNSIGIELCVNSDGDYNKTLELGAELTKYLMDKHNVPLNRVIRHKDASGKYCPRELLNGKNGITWAKFKEMVQGKKPAKPSTPKPSKPKPTPSKPTTSGGSIVNYLKDKKIDSSLANRKKLGVEYGIVSKESQYTGTASQNTALLNAMKSGRKPTTPKPAPKPTGTIKKGSKVKIKTSAKTYSTGENIPTGRKNKTYTVQQTGSKGALIKELYSWVRTGDLALVSGGGTVSSKPSTSTVKVGQTVTATKLYATGASTKNTRKSSIKGYVDRINNNWRNEIRLRNKKGGHYIGFTRKEDIR